MRFDSYDPAAMMGPDGAQFAGTYLYGGEERYRTFHDWCMATFRRPDPPPESWLGRMIATYGYPRTRLAFQHWLMTGSGYPGGDTVDKERLALELGALADQIDDAIEGPADDPDPEVLGDAEIDAIIEQETRR